MAGSMRLVASPDTWELRVYLGRDSSGKVKHRYLRFRGSKRQAERELARLVAEQEAGPEPIVESGLKWNASTTINEAISAWQANGWDDLSPSTTRRYESIWKVHISQAVGNRKISSLSTYELEQYYRQMKNTGLAEATVRQTRAILNRACRLARKWSGGVLPNPVADSELPNWSIADENPVRSPSLEEVQRLISASSQIDPRMATMVRLVIATGMRRGEACAIRWCDFNPDDRTIAVSKSIVGAKGQAQVKSPKTRAGIRKVAIDQGTSEALEDLRRIQKELADLSDCPLTSESYIFSFAPGGEKPPYPDSISHNFMRLRKLAGVPADIHLHSLRHFQATMLDSVISEKQKQSRLGWSNSVMARHYTDSVPEEDRRAALHIGSILDGKDESGSSD